LADDHGIDLATVEGTGAGGNVKVEDVQRTVDALAAIEDTAPPKNVYLKRGLMFRSYELADGTVLFRDTATPMHPDRYKEVQRELRLGNSSMVEAR